MLKKYLIPDRIYRDIYRITPEALTGRGIRGLVLDIDNTLVTYDDPKPTTPVLEWFGSMTRAGIGVSFVSNNSHERVDLFKEGTGFYGHGKSGKPGGRYIREAMRHMGTDAASTALIGDQLLTDISAGKKAGVALSLFVPPIKDKTTLFFRFKRLIERPYLKKYYKLHPDETPVAVNGWIPKVSAKRKGERAANGSGKEK